jgi:hypothetical protein
MVVSDQMQVTESMYGQAAAKDFCVKNALSPHFAAVFQVMSDE